MLVSRRDLLQKIADLEGHGDPLRLGFPRRKVLQERLAELEGKPTTQPVTGTPSIDTADRVLGLERQNRALRKRVKSNTAEKLKIVADAVKLPSEEYAAAAAGRPDFLHELERKTVVAEEKAKQKGRAALQSYLKNRTQ